MEATRFLHSNRIQMFSITPLMFQLYRMAVGGGGSEGLIVDDGWWYSLLQMIVAGLVGLLLLYAVAGWVRRWLAKPDFTGKTVWITGASSGIGQQLAYEFNRLGARLILTARNVKELQRVSQACSSPERVRLLPLDMTKYQQVREKTAKLLAQLQGEGLGVDVVVQNAGVSMRSDLVSYSFANHVSMFQLNVHAPFNHLQVLVPHMLQRGKGQVVGITSLAAKLAKAYRSSYAGSKHAFLGVLDSMRAELGPRGIAFTNILPGYIKTNLSKNALTAAEGERFGRDDENAAKGMDAGEMARQAVRAIYLRENEIYIGKEWLPVIALILRNICPDLAFRALASSAKDTPPAFDKRS